jgi:hypothetical protein
VKATNIYKNLSKKMNLEPRKFERETARWVLRNLFGLSTKGDSPETGYIFSLMALKFKE